MRWSAQAFKRKNEKAIENPAPYCRPCCVRLCEHHCLCDLGFPRASSDVAGSDSAAIDRGASCRLITGGSAPAGRRCHKVYPSCV